MHVSNSEVGFEHLLSQPLDLLSSVTEDDCLSDCQGFVEVAKSVEFPFFLLHSNEELLDSFESKLITFHQNANGIVHELRRHLQNFMWKGSRNKNHLY